MARVALPLTNFQNPDGSAVANGYLRIRLNQDGTSGGEQIQTNFTKIPLDSSGNITGSPTFWPNASILPTGTYYILEVFNTNGQLIAGPNKLTV
jgi:hypothetical protein